MKNRTETTKAPFVGAPERRPRRRSSWQEYLADADPVPYATDRDESEPCQKGTVGCSVDHSPRTKIDPATGERFGSIYPNCETW